MSCYLCIDVHMCVCVYVCLYAFMDARMHAPTLCKYCVCLCFRHVAILHELIQALELTRNAYVEQRISSLAEYGLHGARLDGNPFRARAIPVWYKTVAINTRQLGWPLSGMRVQPTARAIKLRSWTLPTYVFSCSCVFCFFFFCIVFAFCLSTSGRVSQVIETYSA